MMKNSYFLLFLAFIVIFINSNNYIFADRLSEESKTHPMTVKDFINVTKCADLEISPDGKYLVFTQIRQSLEDNKNYKSIWIYNIEKKEFQKITNSNKADFSPKWSPDGKKLAFISTRDDVPQIWQISMEGGEAKKMTDISTGIDCFKWSPDGKSILFSSFVFPDCINDKENQEKQKKLDDRKVNVYEADSLMYRHWDSWKEGKRNHLFLFTLTDNKIVDLTPKQDQDTPPFVYGGDGDFDFSPDGTEIVYTTKNPVDEASSTDTNLYRYDLKSGKATKITENKGSDSSPKYSPDGKYIAYKAQLRPRYEADRFRLMLYENSTGKIINCTEEYDRWISEFCWSPDGKKVYFTTPDAGHESVCVIDLGSSQIRKIINNHYNATLNITPAGDKLYYISRSFNFPHTIFSADVNGENIEQISTFNDSSFKEIAMNQPEEIWYEGANGDKIQAFMIKPPFFKEDVKYPAIIMIHGGPENAFSDNWYTNWNAQVFAGAGYVVFIPNFHGSEGYGQNFIDAVNHDWGGKPYEDIMLGFDYLTKQTYIDPERIGAAGGSYGGYMVNWILGHTDKFKCLISMAGVYNIVSMYGATEELWFPEWEFGGSPYENREEYEKWSPINFVKNFKTPCLVVAGDKDYRVHHAESQQLFTALQKMKVPSRFLYFTNEGHWLQRHKNNEFWYKEFISWMDKYLK